jgi:hypothetical protein
MNLLRKRLIDVYFRKFCGVLYSKQNLRKPALDVPFLRKIQHLTQYLFPTPGMKVPKNEITSKH